MLLHLHAGLAVTTWQHLRRLGGPGLVLLGIADNSVVPLTGSMDVLTIWLAARHREPWPYYAAMATIGAVIGGYITYALARKGGKELDREDAFQVYASLPVGARTYAAVARAFGISPRTVERYARDGRWRNRLRAIETDAARQADEQLGRSGVGAVIDTRRTGG